MFCRWSDKFSDSLTTSCEVSASPRHHHMPYQNWDSENSEVYGQVNGGDTDGNGNGGSDSGGGH